LGGLAHLNRIEANMKRSWFGLLAIGVSGVAWSAGSEAPPLDAAVRVFLGQTVTTKPMPSSGSDPSGASASAVSGDHSRVVVRRGETLARIVRTHFKGSPFREDFIYKAFVALNPEAFPRKTHHVVTAGASLRVPTHAELLAMAEGKSPAAAQGSAMGAAARAPSDQRKQWVRFP
jgi:Tfp pilus assembly protein FimV